MGVLGIRAILFGVLGCWSFGSSKNLPVPDMGNDNDSSPCVVRLPISKECPG